MHFDRCLNVSTDGEEIMSEAKSRSKYMHQWQLGGAVVERWTRDRKVAGSTPGRGAVKSTRSTQPVILPG